MKKTGRVMGVDIETYSDVDIAKAGVYAYAESPEFEILLIAYQIDNGPVKVIETWPQVWKADRENLDRMAGPRGCKEFWDALTDPTVIKYAYNANFERTCLAAWTGHDMPPEQWRCTMVHAATLGLPGSLGAVGAALGLPEDKQKDKAGKALIQYFCKPCKPTKANGGRLRNMPTDAPEKWAQFVEYNRQDVVTEAAIRDRLSVYPVPEVEQQLWSLDQHMNDHGIRVDMGLVRNILQFDAVYQEKLLDEARRITGIENPNSLSQLKDWFFRECGLDVKSLTKDTIPGLEEDLREFRGGLLIDQEAFDKGTRMLKIRTELGKVSTKKYIAMENAVCRDGRLRGILQFYGANRTGRWAGRIVQVHNLPQNKIPDIDLARALAAEGDFEGMQLLFGEVPFVFSQLIRTAFVPDPGCTFVVADFSAIEARVVAWLAGEEWVLEAFRQGKDIYCETASQMYHVPVEKHGQNSHLRQKGKVATLACSYQGGVGAMKAMDKSGTIPEEELQGIVNQWREANPNIVRLWRDYEAAAKVAIQERRTVKRGVRVQAANLAEREYMAGGPVRPYSVREGVYVAFEYLNGNLFVRLPSGRKLCYWDAKVETDPETGRDQITYAGVEQATRQWSRRETYGGKLVENIVQATARDCLAETMRKVDAAGYSIVMHIHDEIVCEVPYKDGGNLDDLKAITDIMAQPVEWAPGLPLRGDGYVTPFYKKD